MPHVFIYEDQKSLSVKTRPLTTQTGSPDSHHMVPS